MQLKAIYLFFIVAIYVFIFLNISNSQIIGSDFISYYAGASIIKDGKGSQIYNKEVQKSYFESIQKPYIYIVINRFASLPFVTLLYLPFTLFPYFFAYKLFLIFNAALLIFLMALIVRTFKISLKLLPIVIVLHLFYSPVFVSLLMAQLSFILAIIILYLYIFIKSKKFFLAGILASFFVLMKPQYVVILPFLFLLSEKRIDFLKGLSLFSLVITVINIYLSGIDALLSYPSFITSSENPEYGNRAYQMFTIHGSLSYLFFNSKLNDPREFIINLLGYSASLFLFIKRYKKLTFDYSFIASIFLTILFSTHTLTHDLTILLIPLFILTHQIKSIKEIKPTFKLLISFFLFIFPLSILFGKVIIGVFIFLLLTLLLLYW